MAAEFSVIIPARDEELRLPACLDALKKSLSAADAAAEIIVVLNRCTDRTEQIARAAGCVIRNCDEKNLSVIRNAGIFAATGEIIVTIDADSRVSRGYFKGIRRILRNGRVVGGGTAMYPERVSLGILLTWVYLATLVLRFGITAGSFFARREDVLAIGGFDPEKLSAEDIDFGVRLKAHGRKKGMRFATLLRAYIVTSCRKFDHFGDWYVLRDRKQFKELLLGKNREFADRHWYDFPRK